MATIMKNIKISEGSGTAKENHTDIGWLTSEVTVDMPTKPTGTRPCSPSESDISVYALPPPAYHASWIVLLAIPAPTTIAAPTESVSEAQSISPAPASAQLLALPPAVHATTPAVVQSLSLGTPAQPAPARTRGYVGVSDVESMENRRRRRNNLADNAVVRGVRRAGGASVWFAQDLHRRRPWIIKGLAFVLVTDLVIFLILLIVARAT
jgi:hypothetical protein